jgi:hypothetical protein
MGMTKRTTSRQSYMVIAVSAWRQNTGFGVIYGSQSGQKCSDLRAAQGYSQAGGHVGTVIEAHAASATDAQLPGRRIWQRL